MAQRAGSDIWEMHRDAVLCRGQRLVRHVVRRLFRLVGRRKVSALRFLAVGYESVGRTLFRGAVEAQARHHACLRGAASIRDRRRVRHSIAWAAGLCDRRSSYWPDLVNGAGAHPVTRSGRSCRALEWFADTVLAPECVAVQRVFQGLARTQARSTSVSAQLDAAL